MHNATMYCVCLDDKLLPTIKKLDYVPVGLGNAKFSKEWLKDDTLENISHKNKCRGRSEHFYSLVDFIAPRDSNHQDYIGAFVVSAGHGLDDIVQHYEDKHDDFSAIMAKVLADRLAEAFAEYLHRQARRDCGFGLDEGLSPQDLIGEAYRGIRPAPGYPGYRLPRPTRVLLPRD